MYDDVMYDDVMYTSGWPPSAWLEVSFSLSFCFIMFRTVGMEISNRMCSLTTECVLLLHRWARTTGWRNQRECVLLLQNVFSYYTGGRVPRDGDLKHIPLADPRVARPFGRAVPCLVFFRPGFFFFSFAAFWSSRSLSCLAFVRLFVYYSSNGKPADCFVFLRLGLFFLFFLLTQRGNSLSFAYTHKHTHTHGLSLSLTHTHTHTHISTERAPSAKRTTHPCPSCRSFFFFFFFFFFLFLLYNGPAHLKDNKSLSRLLAFSFFVFPFFFSPFFFFPFFQIALRLRDKKS